MSEEMTIREYADLIGVSPDTIRRHIKSHKLPAVEKVRDNVEQWFVQVGMVREQSGEYQPSTANIAEWLVRSPWLEVVGRSIDKNGDVNWTVRARSTAD